MPVALWEAQTLQNHSADADAVPGCRAPLGERRFLSTHDSFRLGLKRCVHRPSKRETGQAVRLCPPGARGASLRLDRPIRWLFHSGPQGSIGAIPGLVYPCKDRAATAGIGLYIRTDYAEQWISWWLQHSCYPSLVIFTMHRACSQPAKTLGVLTTWLSFNTPT